MKFYDCATAPSPRLVRMFIAEKGLTGAIETVEVNLREREQMGAAFRAINPFCTVPVLEADDGTRFLTTQGCWRYLEEIHPDPALLGTGPAEKAAIADAVWRAEQDGFFAVGEALRNKARGMQDRALTGPTITRRSPNWSNAAPAGSGISSNCSRTPWPSAHSWRAMISRRPISWPSSRWSSPAG